MSTMTYKGFEIEAAPSRLRSGEWTVKVHISIKRDGNTLSRTCDALDTFSTREEATHYCFDFGRKVIDGQVKEISLDDL